MDWQSAGQAAEYGHLAQESIGPSVEIKSETMTTEPPIIAIVLATSEIGGSDIAMYRLATHLDRSRFRPIVIVPRESTMSARFHNAGIPVFVVPMLQPRPTLDLAYQLRFLIAFWPSVIRLTRLLRRKRTALVHSKSLLSLYAPIAGALVRIPNVQQIGELPELPAPVVWILTRTLVRLSDRVLPASEAVAYSLFGPDSRRDSRITALYDGIELDEFRPDANGEGRRQILGVPLGVPLIGFVGRLDPWKGADVFVRAAAQIARKRSDARFVVCGGDLPGHEDYAHRVRRLAIELGISDRLTFAGWVDPAAMPEWMAAIDVLVHASVRPEPLGLVNIEAMATGKPVVAANAGGVPEVVQDGVTGLVTRPGDWLEIADAVVRLIDAPEVARAMGQAGRKRVETLFEVSAHTRKMEAVYDSVLAHRSHGRPRDHGSG
jgi:glycosyltransferase involved in cell wall biosynthesis